MPSDQHSHDRRPFAIFFVYLTSDESRISFGRSHLLLIAKLTLGSLTTVLNLDFSSRTKDDDLSLDLDFGTKDHWSGLGLEGHLTDHGL